MDKRPRSVVSPSGLRPFLAVSQNAFRPGDPRNGPESRFFFSDPTIIWEKGNLGALGSAGASLLLGERTKVYVPFRAPGARKNGPSTGKTELMAATALKFWSFLPLESSAPFFLLPTKRCSWGWWYEGAISKRANWIMCKRWKIWTIWREMGKVVFSGESGDNAEFL